MLNEPVVILQKAVQEISQKEILNNYCAHSTLTQQPKMGFKVNEVGQLIVLVPYYIYITFAVPGVKPRVSHMQGMNSTSDPQPLPIDFF